MHDLHKIVHAEPKYMSIDPLGGVLWIAGGKQLTQLSLNQPDQPALQIDLPHEADALSVNPMTGESWVAAKHLLSSYGRNGVMLRTIDLRAHDIRTVRRLAFDPASRALWAAGEQAVIRFSEEGAYVMSLPVKHGDEALGVPAFAMTPILSLLRPPQNALTNDPQPAISYRYDASCNGRPCGFAPDYFSSFSLAATLNRQPIGPFVFDSSTGQASYTPASRLPEGKNLLSAQAKDGFGRVSDTTEDTLTIDTVPPRFISLTPPDGTAVTTPTVTLQGAVDDPGAAIVLDGAGQVPHTSTDGGVLNYSMPVTLQPGLNTFTLTAIDSAGNSTQQTVRLVYSAISVAISSPANGATIDADSVLVTGTFQGGINTGITVNNLIAARDGNRFYAQVPLQAGENTLTVNAAMPGGVEAVQQITVVSTGAGPFSVSASKTYGTAPLTVDFTVLNRSGTGIASIDADFDGNGVADLSVAGANAPIQFVYTHPDVYQTRIRITDKQGSVTEKAVTIVVQDAAQVEQLLRAQWSAMTGALAQGDKAQALSYLTAGARVKYGPVFDVLASDMRSIVAGFSPLQAVSVNGDMGEFALNRTIRGEDRVFLIYFLLGADGVWRLDSM